MPKKNHWLQLIARFTMTPIKENQKMSLQIKDSKRYVKKQF